MVLICSARLGGGEAVATATGCRAAEMGPPGGCVGCQLVTPADAEGTAGACWVATVGAGRGELPAGGGTLGLVSAYLGTGGSCGPGTDSQATMAAAGAGSASTAPAARANMAPLPGRRTGGPDRGHEQADPRRSADRAARQKKLSSEPNRTPATSPRRRDRPAGIALPRGHV